MFPTVRAAGGLRLIGKTRYDDSFHCRRADLLLMQRTIRLETNDVASKFFERYQTGIVQTAVSGGCAANRMHARSRRALPFSAFCGASLRYVNIGSTWLSGSGLSQPSARVFSDAFCPGADARRASSSSRHLVLHDAASLGLYRRC